MVYPDNISAPFGKQGFMRQTFLPAATKHIVPFLVSEGKLRA